MKTTVGLVFLGLVGLCACKTESVVAPAFEVSVPQSSYRVGDTVTFLFDGNPDFIIFYPGTDGRAYEGSGKLNGMPLKGMNTRLENHMYVYTTAGNFTATFIGSVHNVYGKEEVIRPVNLTINP